MSLRYPRDLAPDDTTAEAQRAVTRDAYWLAWARRHHMTGDEARRFLTRQQATLRRQRDQDARTQGRSLLWCCETWHPITHIPYRCPDCGTGYLQKVTPL